MIFYEDDKGIFNFRVAAIIYNKDKSRILMHKSKDNQYWVLPGGRVEFYEQAETAIKRELFEELGIKTEKVKMLWVVENFFEKEEHKVHEISLYYSVDLPQESNLEDNDNFYGIEDKKNIYFAWKTLTEISEINIYPKFLRNSLENISLTIKDTINSISSIN